MILSFIKNILNIKKTNINLVKYSNHHILDKNINYMALKVLKRLHIAGYEAFLVGGCVRDLLLNKSPKDFDVVTNARPEQVKSLFRHCLIIGRRFRLAHVYFGREYIEVATFRSGDNLYGTIEQDVLRRDFTINALYYNYRDKNIYDYTGGIKDLDLKTIRLIGIPKIRFKEDPVRILRALRFIARLDFKLDQQTKVALHESKKLLIHASVNRLFEEYCKFFLYGFAQNSFKVLCEYDLFNYLFPAAKNQKFIEVALKNTDDRYAKNLSLMSAFLLSVFLWDSVIMHAKKIAIQNEEKNKFYKFIPNALWKISKEQNQRLIIPKKLLAQIEDIYNLQGKLINFHRQSEHKIEQIYYRVYFRAALDFLKLRYAAGEHNLVKAVKFWDAKSL